MFVDDWTASLLSYEIERPAAGGTLTARVVVEGNGPLHLVADNFRIENDGKEASTYDGRDHVE